MLWPKGLFAADMASSNTCCCWTLRPLSPCPFLRPLSLPETSVSVLAGGRPGLESQQTDGCSADVSCGDYIQVQAMT